MMNSSSMAVHLNFIVVATGGIYLTKILLKFESINIGWNRNRFWKKFHIIFAYGSGMLLFLIILCHLRQTGSMVRLLFTCMQAKDKYDTSTLSVHLNMRTQRGPALVSLLFSSNNMYCIVFKVITNEYFIIVEFGCWLID